MRGEGREEEEEEEEEGGRMRGGMEWWRNGEIGGKGGGYGTGMVEVILYDVVPV